MSNKKILDELNAMDNELHSFMAKWSFKSARLRNMLGAGDTAPGTRKGNHVKNLVKEMAAKRRMNMLNQKS